LRGAIDWSHDLLDATEQTLFRRLAIFVGGFTIDAAAAVCDPDGELGIDMLDALAAFVDKSLLRGVEAGHGEPRFRMLETIREYAIERLAESDDAELTRRRHEDEFAELARRAEPELLGSSQKDWLDRLEGETDNLRAALGRAADDGRIELALDMGAAMWRFWQQRGHLAEGRAALEGLLGRPAAAGRTAARARALGALGGLIYWQGDVAGAGPFYAESIGIERGLDDPAGLADALYNAGFVAVLTGDVVAGQADYEEAMGIFEAIGDHKGVIRVREGLALLMLHRGDFSAARALQSENLAAFRGSGVQFRVANALSLLGAINMMDGAFEASHACFSEAFAAFRETGDVQAVVRVVMLSAALANAEGDPRRSARLMGAADALKAPLGEIGTPVQMLHLEDPALAARRGLGDDAFEAAYQEGRTLSLDEILPLVQAGTAGAQH
jgi:predicted ATPase